MLLDPRAPTARSVATRRVARVTATARRRALAIFTLLLLGLTVSACGSPASTSTDTSGPDHLRIAYVPATTGLPLVVAEKEGFFAANKLDVTLTQVDNISTVVPTLGRQFDISLGTATDLIRAGGAGIDIVQVAGNTLSTKADPFVKLIVPADSQIASISQINGKTVGSPTLSGVIHVAVLSWAKQHGVDPADIKGIQVPTPNLADQLKAGRVDAAEALEPVASQLIKAGNRSLGDPFASISDPLATNFWIANGAWARSHRPVVDRYVKALNEAKDFIAHNPAAARDILQKYTNLPQAVASTVPLPVYDFTIRTQDLDTWVKVLRDVDAFTGQVDTRKLVLSTGS